MYLMPWHATRHPTQPPAPLATLPPIPCPDSLTFYIIIFTPFILFISTSSCTISQLLQVPLILPAHFPALWHSGSLPCVSHTFLLVFPTHFHSPQPIVTASLWSLLHGLCHSSLTATPIMSNCPAIMSNLLSPHFEAISLPSFRGRSLSPHFKALSSHRPSRYHPSISQIRISEAT